MGTLYVLLEWIALCIGIVIAGFFVAFLLLRRRILAKARADLGEEALLLSTSARIGSVGGEKGSGATVAGLLMLVSNGLYFRSWVGGGEIFIPGPSISWIGVPEARGTRGPGSHAIVVRFLDSTGKEDGVVVRILYPEQWVEAIKTHLITRAV
jgi:hypothetical protein